MELEFENYRMAVLGYLVFWNCNKIWAINQIESRDIKLDYQQDIKPSDCAYKIAGY